MITTFEELIKFLETNSDLQNLGVGVTTYSLTTIDFLRKLRNDDEKVLMEIAKKYDIEKEFQISDHGIQFLMDNLVYKNRQNNMQKLVEFLKELNSKFKLKNFSTGIAFELR